MMIAYTNGINRETTSSVLVSWRATAAAVGSCLYELQYCMAPSRLDMPVTRATQEHSGC